MPAESQLMYLLGQLQTERDERLVREAFSLSHELGPELAAPAILDALHFPSKSIMLLCAQILGFDYRFHSNDFARSIVRAVSDKPEFAGLYLVSRALAKFFNLPLNELAGFVAKDGRLASSDDYLKHAARIRKYWIMKENMLLRYDVVRIKTEGFKKQGIRWSPNSMLHQILVLAIVLEKTRKYSATDVMTRRLNAQFLLSRVLDIEIQPDTAREVIWKYLMNNEVSGMSTGPD